MTELPTPFQSYIHKSRYARFKYDENRRETWEETVTRYFDFFTEHLKEQCDYTLTDNNRKREKMLRVITVPILQ